MQSRRNMESKKIAVDSKQIQETCAQLCFSFFTHSVFCGPVGAAQMSAWRARPILAAERMGLISREPATALLELKLTGAKLESDDSESVFQRLGKHKQMRKWSWKSS